MFLREFTKTGHAEISINESEINALCNALCDYCKSKPKDKRIYELHAELYIIYEILHHGACFDDMTLRIIQKIRDEADEYADEKCPYLADPELLFWLRTHMTSITRYLSNDKEEKSDEYRELAKTAAHSILSMINDGIKPTNNKSKT